MKNKFILLSLFTALSLSFTFCSSENNEEDTSQSTSSSTETNSTTNQDTKDDEAVAPKEDEEEKKDEAPTPEEGLSETKKKAIENYLSGLNSTKPSFTSNEDTTPAGMQWVRVEEMSDEFNGSFDTKKWVKTFWNYGETPVYMKKENSGVSDGHLWIKATLDENNQTQWFETGRVRSKATIKFPMYTECSIKTAHISAFNTFWLNKGDSNNRDEIDIIENNSKPSIKEDRGDFKLTEYPWQMNSQYFIVKNGITERNKGNFNNKNLSDSNPLKGVKWNQTYHIVGAWWKDKNTVQFYLDGEPAGSIKTKQDFTIGQHIIWDLWTQDSNWVGGLALKEDLKDDTINTMKVDWVRTWKLESTQK